MTKIGLDMEQTLGSPGEEKRERKEWLSCFSLVQGGSGTLAKQAERWLGEKGSLRIASISYLCCCKSYRGLHTHLTDA